MPTPSHLYRRGAIWWWRRALPRPARSILGLVEIRASARTYRVSEARCRARRLDVAADALIEVLATMDAAADDRRPVPPIPPELGRRLIRLVVRTVLDGWEDWRAEAGALGAREVAIRAVGARLAAAHHREHLARNDLGEVAEAMAPLLAELGIALQPAAAPHARYLRQTLRALVQANEIKAEREAGRYREDGDLDAFARSIAAGVLPETAHRIATARTTPPRGASAPPAEAEHEAIACAVEDLPLTIAAPAEAADEATAPPIPRANLPLAFSPTVMQAVEALIAVKCPLEHHHIRARQKVGE